jgi:DNA polymerase III subunit alpha
MIKLKQWKRSKYLIKLEIPLKYAKKGVIVMVKIISRQSLGMQNVYDIGVEKEHNFVLDNGLIASNCFNKSHSTAYAYVTYQTAFLKANYPVEYMAALLTANSNDQDKVSKYLYNCEKSGIQVQPPDINKSEVIFKPIKVKRIGEKDKILFGFSAIRNVGDTAMELILKERQENGEYKSLVDFCDRLNLHTVNRKVLEALIKCGAFDNMDSNRQQLLADIELLIPWSQAKAKEREMGQGNLFDLFSGSTTENKKDKFDSIPKAPAVADASPMIKLEWEKEYLGLYVSTHPLKSAEQLASAKNLTLTPISELLQIQGKSRKVISLIVLVTEIKKIVTKNGGNMAILKMEDLTGQAEAVVFPRVYELFQSKLNTNIPLILKGKGDRQEGKEQAQLIVDDVEVVTSDELKSAVAENKLEEQGLLPEVPLEQQQIINNLTLLLKLAVHQVNDHQLRELKSLLQEYSGAKDQQKSPVMAIVANDKEQKKVRFGPEYAVQNAEDVATRLRDRGFAAEIVPALFGHPLSQ